MLRVLHLDPVIAAASAIGALGVLRHQPLQIEFAGLAKQVGADLALLERRNENPSPPIALQAIAVVRWSAGKFRRAGHCWQNVMLGPPHVDVLTGNCE